MKKVNLISGGSFIFTGLLIAFGPQSIFHVCRSDGDMVMRCFYTAKAELAIGLLITVLGILFIFEKKRISQIAIATGVAFSSVIAFLIPNILIGVCGSAHMHCKAVTQPALTLLSILTFVVSAGVAILFARENAAGYKEEKANA